MVADPRNTPACDGEERRVPPSGEGSSDEAEVAILDAVMARLDAAAKSPWPQSRGAHGAPGVHRANTRRAGGIPSSPFAPRGTATMTGHEIDKPSGVAGDDREPGSGLTEVVSTLLGRRVRDLR